MYEIKKEGREQNRKVEMKEGREKVRQEDGSKEKGGRERKKTRRVDAMMTGRTKGRKREKQNGRKGQK